MKVILGPTSSGKSDYAIRLAKEIDGEIISADSRQVYRGMDIGSGKVPRDPGSKDGAFFSGGIRHHLLDIASPMEDYNVTHFLRDAGKAIADIKRRGKTPILCGGTAFWIEALLLGTFFPEVKPDKMLRAKLEKLSAEELFTKLEEQDADRAISIDAKNKVRLIRALEIIEAIGKVPKIRSKERGARNEDIKIIALNPPKEILLERIEKRLKDRLAHGMLDEVRHLNEQGISWERLENFGLEYRWCARYLQGKISHENMESELLRDSKHYAKRQLTFIRRLERSGLEIEWTPSKENLE